MNLLTLTDPLSLSFKCRYWIGQIAAFPNITLSLDGAAQEILVSPESYLVNNPGTAADFCLGIEDNGVGVGSVLGDVVMQVRRSLAPRAHSWLSFVCFFFPSP